MKITKKQQYILVGGGVLLVSIAIAVPLIVQSTKQTTTSFNLSIIKSHMHIATKSKTTLENTKVAIVNMYQNGTTAKLSSQAQKAAQALANYIYVNKESKKFAFVLGKDHQDQHLLLLTIANHSAKSQANAFLQRAIRQVPIVAQKQQELSLVKQLPWITSALHKAEFGILFWIYQHRLSSQAAIKGTSIVPAPITAVNFQRVKTPHEQLQDQAWAKMIQVIFNLTSSQLKIRVNAQQLPSQTKITASHIVLAIQNIITNDDALSKATSKLIKEDNIEVQPIDKTGAMMITIKNYGPAKIITIFGFKATATPLEIARAKIKDAKNGASLPTKLNQVSHGQIPTTSDVSVPMKDGVIFKFQSATAINNKGESTLTYEVDANPQIKGTALKDITFVVSGFETQVQASKRLAQAAIQNLTATNFTTSINKTKIASIGKPLKVNVITDIKKQINNIHAKALILPGDITITPNNIAKIVTIVIHNHGPIRTITIVGFRTIKDYLDQVLNAIPSSGGPWVIPEGITSSQFDDYVQAMGNSSTIIDDGTTINKFAKQYRVKITSLTIPHSFTMIGPWFQHFDKIISLSIPDSVTTIENYAFYYVPLTTLALGENLQTIGVNAFANALLKSLAIPNSVTTIGDYAFANSPLTTLTLGENLQTIGGRAFYNAKLKMLTIPNAVTAIGDGAFTYSPLTTLSLGNKCQTIGTNAFYNAKLTSLRIPASVTTIGNWAFWLSPLGNVNIFQNVKFVGSPFGSAVIVKRIPRSD